MKISIMQPYFMPYLGYLALIKHADLFVLFDTPQFIRHGWIERNRILKIDGDTFYIKLPLIKHHRHTPIKDVFINNNLAWKNKILSQLLHYKKKAPYYKQVKDLLVDIFEIETNSVVDFNHYSLMKICQYLKIETPIKVWSKMNIEIDEVNAADEWALNISKALNAETYYNPPGGKSFFNITKYDKAGIELKFLQLKLSPYKQFQNEFVPSLSIIDVLMFCNVVEVREMLEKINEN